MPKSDAEHARCATAHPLPLDTTSKRSKMSMEAQLRSSPFVPVGGTVRVALMTPPAQIRITIYSKAKYGAAMRRDTEYASMVQFKGGEEHAVATVACAVAEQMNFQYGDNFDDYQVAKAAIAGFRDVKKQYDMDMLLSRALEVDEDIHVRVDAASTDNPI